MGKAAAIESGAAITTTDDHTESPKTSSAPLASTVLDVKPLDDYLLSLLLPTFEQPPRFKWLRPALQFLTLWTTAGQTPAVRLLGLDFTSSCSNDDSKSSHRTRRLLSYAALSVLLPCLYRIMKEWLQQQQQQSRNPQNDHLADIQRTALERRKYIAQRLVDAVERTWPMLRLACLLTCWGNLTSTPDPAMVAMGYTYKRNVEQPLPRLHVDYAHRRWLYEELSRTARVLFAGWTLMAVWKPLLHDTLVWPLVRLWNRHFYHANQKNTKCPVCRSETMTIPVLTNCGHAYCYTCLYKESIQKPRMTCVLCGHVIQSSERVSNG